MSTPEDAVRSYLQFLDDPESVRDHAAIAEATELSQNATDPIDRLKALSTLQRLEAVDGEAFRSGFVTHAAAWARDHAVTPEAFVALGVPNDVLVEAGVIQAKRPSHAGSANKRRTRVSPGTVRASVPLVAFTIADLEAASGASTATVRKVIAEMIDTGDLRDLGPDQKHTGRGRAPLLFTRA